MMLPVQQVLTVVRKDLLVESRARDLLTVMLYLCSANAHHIQPGLGPTRANSPRDRSRTVVADHYLRCHPRYGTHVCA